jgi:ankyrin repeat protein
MKIILTSIFIFLISFTTVAQQNKLHSSEFWKTDPTLDKVKQLIAEGNNPVELNENGFDATVYAIIRKANNDIIEFLLHMKGNHPNKKTHDSRNYLHWAAYSGNLQIVNTLLQSGSSVTELDSHGNTPLTFAANSGLKDAAIYSAFQKYGVDLSAEKNDNSTNLLLLAAASLENENELNQFLSYGLSLDSLDEDGNNIFHYAVTKGNIAFLKLLIEKGVNHKSINKNGGNAMLKASRGARGHQNNLELFTFLESQDIEVNVVGDNGRNPLHAVASTTKNIALLDYFIDHGVDINLQDDNGNSPFINAVRSNNMYVVSHLYKKVNNLNAQNENGQTALTMAVYRNTPEMVAFLIKNNADTSIIDKKGNNLAYYLVNSYSNKNVNNFKEKLKLLKSKGVFMKAKQAEGNTLYHIAVLKGNLNLIKQLDSFDININTKNDEGMTALHLAAMKAEDDLIIKHLISQGADPKIRTEFNESVFDLASENEILENKNIPLNFLK